MLNNFEAIQTRCLFQSAPGLEAGRCHWTHPVYLSMTTFQSAPGLEAGRCTCSDRAMPGWLCFNPRPALRPGDADSAVS